MSWDIFKFQKTKTLRLFITYLMEERNLNRSSTSAGGSTRRKSQSLSPSTESSTIQKTAPTGLNLNVGIGSLEEDMLSFLKTTDRSPKTARTEDNESLRRDLSKSQNQVTELQEQLKKLKDLSRRAMEDFEHFKHSMEIERVRYKEALFTIESLKKTQFDNDELTNLQQTKIHLENQLLEMKDEVSYARQGKSLVERQLEESRSIAQAFEQQLAEVKNAAETQNKSKQQITSFNSEIGKELKQLTQAKKDLENSLQLQMDKYAKGQLQLGIMDTELIRIGKELEKEKIERRIECDKIKSLEISLTSSKKQLEIAMKEKDDKHGELTNMKLKYELLIGDLHVKVSEIEKLKSDVKYEENMRIQAEKQMKTFQDLLKRRGENSAIASDVEIAKIASYLSSLEEQKAGLGAEIKSLMEDKIALINENHDKVKDYEVVRFKQDDGLRKNKLSTFIDQSTPGISVTDSPTESKYDFLNFDQRSPKESSSIDISTTLNISGQNLSPSATTDDKIKKQDKENWRDKANNLIKKSRNEEDVNANLPESEIGRGKTIRILGEGTVRAKQLKNLTIAKLKKQREVILFGGLLQERADFECKPVPKIVTACIKVVELKGLKTEGIYRRAGAMKEMKQMQDEWEQGIPVDMANEFMDVLSVSSLLKAYFRDLKVPLIPNDVYEVCVLIVKEPKLSDEHLNNFKISLKKLAPAHYNTLYYLIQHLQQYSIN